jgi:hypothetical protein
VAVNPEDITKTLVPKKISVPKKNIPHAAATTEDGSFDLKNPKFDSPGNNVSPNFSTQMVQTSTRTQSGNSDYMNQYFRMMNYN